MLRPEPRVLADGALVPDANVISPPPNRFTHELVRDVPYRLDRPARAHEPDGVLEAGSSVVLLVDGPELCWVVDASGLYVEVSLTACARFPPAEACRRRATGAGARPGPAGRQIGAVLFTARRPPRRRDHARSRCAAATTAPDDGGTCRALRSSRSGSTRPTSAPSARDASPAAEQVSRRLPARACGRPFGCAVSDPVRGDGPCASKTVWAGVRRRPGGRTSGARGGWRWRASRLDDGLSRASRVALSAWTAVGDCGFGAREQSPECGARQRGCTARRCSRERLVAP